MNWMRRNWIKVLFVLVLFALPGADVECEDDELEINWPSFGRHYDGYYYYPEPIFIEPAPCCWYW